MCKYEITCVKCLSQIATFGQGVRPGLVQENLSQNMFVLGWPLLELLESHV